MLRIVIAAFLSALLAAPASAQEAEGPNDGKWGAIAYGGPKRATGVAVNFPNPDEARRAALDDCGGRCSRSIVFLRTCAAVAEGPAGAAFGSNRWRGRAIARPLTQCGKSGAACASSAWACTH